ncbi:MAG: hypothetical protein RLZZ511_3772 [Cyanobacteriota bacterium]
MSQTPAATSEAAIVTDALVWNGLKLAIAQSSGFQRWQEDCEQQAAVANGDASLDTLVYRYLRETLETLAY